MQSLDSLSRPTTTQEREYNATIQFSFDKEDKETGEEHKILVLISNVTGKVMLLRNEGPIEFELLSGQRTEWVSLWGMIDGMPLFVVGDGTTSALSINTIDGVRESLGIPGIKDEIFALERTAMIVSPESPYVIIPRIRGLSEFECDGSA